jgi:hypothetical protein
MKILAIIWLLLINLITLDILCGLLQRHTRESSYSKVAGLLGLLLLAITPGPRVVYNQNTAFLRYILGFFTAALLSWAAVLLLKSEQPDSTLVALILFISMPFYHLLYALVGHNIIYVTASIKNFRIRSMLALVMAANIFMISLNIQQNILIISIHAIFALIALAHVLYFTSLTRAKAQVYNLHNEEYDVTQPSFMNYLCGLLEFFLYSLLSFLSLGPSLMLAIDATSMPPVHMILPIYFIMLYLAAFIIAKIFLVSRAIIKSSLYEEYLLPLSFIFFGISYIYTTYN